MNKKEEFIVSSICNFINEYECLERPYIYFDTKLPKKGVYIFCGVNNIRLINKAIKQRFLKEEITENYIRYLSIKNSRVLLESNKYDRFFCASNSQRPDIIILENPDEKMIKLSFSLLDSNNSLKKIICV